MVQPEELLAIHREATRLVESWIGLDQDSRRSQTVSLRPRDDDFWQVFIEESVPRAAGAYEAFWAGNPVIDVTGSRRAHVTLALGISLWRAIPEFPKEYEHVIPHLRRRNVWACWTYRGEDGKVTAAYNGLVRLRDGRWAWFPSPWLFVGNAAVVGKPSPAAHWID
jgi:hypothetical protein